MGYGHRRKRTLSQNQKALKFHSQYFHLGRNVESKLGLGLRVWDRPKISRKILG
jgi:hypothetical protein